MKYMNKTSIITGVVALIVGVGIGYSGAHAFAHGSTASQSARGGYAAFGGAMGGMRGGTGGGFLTGTVSAKDSGSITLNTKDGSSHVVLVTPNTTVSKSVNGTLDDVANGATVIVSGTTNSDGSVSASLIQLRPAMPQQQPAQ